MDFILMKRAVNMRRLPVLLMLCLLCIVASATRAQAFKCDVTATGVNFGSYDVFSPVPLDSTGSINISCNIPSKNPHAPLAVTVSLSPGNSGSFAQRAMQQAGGPDQMNYNLYTNASMSTIWGDDGGSSSVQTAFVTRDMPYRATIYGRIPARQNVRAGSYGDVITVTIEY